MYVFALFHGHWNQESSLLSGVLQSWTYGNQVYASCAKLADTSSLGMLGLSPPPLGQGPWLGMTTHTELEESLFTVSRYIFSAYLPCFHIPLYISKTEPPQHEIDSPRADVLIAHPTPTEVQSL